MSIIFDKLRGLKKDSGSYGKQTHKLTQKRDLYNFKRFVFSPVGSIVVLFFIVVFGVLSFYSLFFLKTYIDKKSTQTLTTNYSQEAVIDTGSPTGKGQKTTANTDPISGTSEAPDEVRTKAGLEPIQIPDIPEPGEDAYSHPIQTKFQPKRGKLFLPSAGETSAGKINEVPQIKHPASSTEKIAETQLENFQTNAPPLPVFQKKNTDLTQQAPSIDFKSAPQLEKKILAESGSIKYQNSNHALIQANEMPSTPKKMLTSVSPPVQKLSIEELSFQKGRLLKTKKMESTSQIAQLTQKIETSLKKGDFQAAEKLLNRLSQYKNSDTDYILKLKAFLAIKAGRLESATQFLDKILEKNPDDLEASMNMAVIEIKKNLFDQAKKRLLRLQEIHPSNRRVDALLSHL